MTEKASFTIRPDLQKPSDPILGVTKAFKDDPRDGKINAGVGVYADHTGKTFTPLTVRETHHSLPFGTADYLGPTGKEEYLGDRKFLEGTARLVFGDIAEKLLADKKLAAIGAVGGTGAIALMAESIHEITPDAPLLIGTPTWPNHIQIAEAKRVPVITYSHMKDNRFDMDAQIDAINKSPEDTVVLFHTGKTHNPTGVNPQTADEWRTIARTMNGRRALFDTPYAGFADGLVQDTEAIRIFQNEGVPLAVTVSYAKTGGLYRERPAALLVPQDNQDDALKLQRYLNYKARVSYSSPPAQGERVMGEVLSDAKKIATLSEELTIIAADLKNRRKILADEIPELNFVTEQTGLFSMLPLKENQIAQLRSEHAIYMPNNGRVNFGGITPTDMPRFAQAIKEVL